MNSLRKVKLSARAKKDLRKVPIHIALKLDSWVRQVGEYGLSNVRKIKGFHDEPLHGNRKDQRSIRLNISYRAIYEVKSDGLIEFVEVEEVTNHEY